MNFKTIKQEEIYKGKIISLVKDTIELPDGRTTTRDVVLHNGAAAIVPVDNQGNILFVRQYRHPAKEELIEIPAGTLEKGEDPLECAKRELEEETGYKASKFSYICSMYTAVGFCTEIIHIYLAKDLVKTNQNLDEDEFITIEKYSLKEAIDMIFHGIIKDSKTIAGIFATKELIENNKY
ncbi:NUDIX domain-containing protein [Defluviitalea phaphyphila]|uniref:NUDIX domain-containing protein n=1 Tax=Defluviitalea phaphyphila TaxID=1473580 RepID=UPI0007307152|nr:NUDIX hydrolase [Defluviitalea phaphyphila]